VGGTAGGAASWGARAVEGKSGSQRAGRGNAGDDAAVAGRWGCIPSGGERLGRSELSGAPPQP
jgi:hypothetical protein